MKIERQASAPLESGESASKPYSPEKIIKLEAQKRGYLSGMSRRGEMKKDQATGEWKLVKSKKGEALVNRAREEMEADLASKQTVAAPQTETSPTGQRISVNVGGGFNASPASGLPAGPEAAPAPQVSPEEIARQEKEKKDNLMLYHIVSGDRQAKEVPADFEATQETKEAAESFFRSKDGLLEAYKKEFQAKRLAKKSGNEQGGAATAEAVIWRENAQKDYEKKLEGLKKELFEDFIVKKHEKYPNLSKKEMQEEALKYNAGFILETAKDIDMDLEAEKNRVAYETKERGIASKLWEKYTKAPRWKKMAIGAGVAGAVGLAGALAFPSFLLFAGSSATLAKVGVGGFLAGKAVRSVTGGALGAAIFSGIEKFHIRGKYGKKRAETGTGQSTETLEKLKEEIGTAEDWLENEEKKMKLMAIVDADAIKYREKLGKIANKEGRSRLYAALAAGIIGGAAATAAGLDWSQVFPGGPKGAALVGALENKPSGGGVGAYEGLDVESGPDNLPASPEKIISGIETAKPGDSVWRMAERQLEQRIPGFQDLNEAQKTYLVDAIKDRIAENPEKFGLTDPDKLAIGQKIDFSSVFEKDSDLQELVGKAKGLTQAQMENIGRNNATLRDWVKAHPGEALTSDKVEDILRGRGGGTIGGDQNLDLQMENPSKAGAPAGEVTNPDFNKEPPSAEFTPDHGGGGEVSGGGAETLPKVSEFGTNYETQIAERFGFTPDQFNVTKGITVEKLLQEIPIDKDEQVQMWARFSNNNPPDLWPSDEPYYSSILKKQAELAEFLWTRFPRPDINPDLQKLTVEEVINRLHLGA